MALRVVNAGSASANYHVFIRRGTIPTDSVSVGAFTNQRTFRIPIDAYNSRITVAGTFGSGSASTAIAIDVGPNGSAFVNMFSISSPFTSVIPIYADDIIRIRHVWSSAAATIAGTSVDVWIG